MTNEPCPVLIMFRFAIPEEKTVVCPAQEVVFYSVNTQPAGTL